MQHEGRDGGDQPKLCRYEGFGDAAGKAVDVGIARDADLAKGRDHTCDGAKQPQQRGGCRCHGNEGKEAFQSRLSFKYFFGQDLLEQDISGMGELDGVFQQWPERAFDLGGQAARGICIARLHFL